MNPLLNPLISLPFLKNYLTDPNRLNRLSSRQLDRYRDRAFRKIVSYAATVPLYQEKYTKAGVSPKDFQTIRDITKHPFISKQDLIDNFPNNIIPRTYKKENAHVVCTGGSTGKPVSLSLRVIQSSMPVYRTIGGARPHNRVMTRCPRSHGARIS